MDDPSLTYLILSVVFIIFGSAFCSSAEAALFSINDSKARSFVDEKRRNASTLLKIIESKERYIFAIVVLNNFINIMGAAYFAMIVSKLFGQGWISAASIGLTIAIIIFGEIFPKTIGSQRPDAVALTFAKPVLLVNYLVYPVTKLVAKASDLFIRAIFDIKKDEIAASESEIKHLLKEAAQYQNITKREKDLIENIFSLNDVKAESIMTPRRVVTKIRGDSTLAEIESVIDDSPHSRIVVVGESDDDLIGIVLLRDLSEAYRKFPLSTKIRDLDSVNEKEALIKGGEIINTSPITVSEQTPAEILLVRFQRTKEHLAIVKDRFGGISGVVSLEDVLEIIVGEISDETDEAPNLQEVALRIKREEKAVYSK